MCETLALDREKAPAGTRAFAKNITAEEAALSTHNSTVPLPAGRRPRFYVARSAKQLTGIAHQTIAKYLTPDAWSVSMRGDKSWPMWEESRLLAWAAERREAQGGAR